MELRIAIVEDQEPEARRLELLLRRAFQGDRPICTRFSSGDDLLARFTTGAYEVVFLDICMAGTNGIETARQLREAAAGERPAAPHRLCDLLAGICVGCLPGASLRLLTEAL